MANLTIMVKGDQERGRQWSRNFKNLLPAFVKTGTVKRYLSWKAPELTGEEPELEERVDEFMTRGEFELNRLIHRNKIRADEY